MGANGSGAAAEATMVPGMVARALWVRAGRCPAPAAPTNNHSQGATQALCLLCLAVVVDKVESACMCGRACMECVSTGGVANAWLLVCPGVVGPYAVLRRAEQQPANKPATTTVCCKPGTILPSLEMCVLHALLDFGGFTTSERRSTFDVRRTCSRS